MSEDLVEARLDNLEKQLFQMASKGHRTMYRQTEEAAPLAKLEATIRLLDSEFQQFRGTDPKRLIDTLVSQHNTNFRKEIEERLATRASEDELLQFQKDIFRIEAFTRETQVNVFALKSKLEGLGSDLESRFTEKRWSALEASLLGAATKQQEELQKELRGHTTQQQEQMEAKLKGVQSLLSLLEKEVRTQYGPEMLQEHMRALEQGLAATVRSSIADAGQQLTAKVANYEGQTQALRQLVLEAVADMKQELQGAALQARFKAYEDRLAEQEERYKALDQQYSQLETHLKRQTQAAQDRQSDLYQELEQTQAYIKELDAKATLAQQQVATTCAKWLKEREQTFDTKYGQTEAILSSLQGRALALEEELGIALEQRKKYEATWKEEHAALQKALEEKFTAWTDDKTVYLTGRVVDLTQQLQGTITLTKLHQRRVDELLAEETIRGFVTAIETKVRTTQEEWAQRRNTEFSLKFDTYSKQIDGAYAQLENDRQQAQRDKDELMRTLKQAHKEEVGRTLLQFSNKAEEISANLQKDVKAGIQEVDRIKAEITALQDAYKQQTSEAIASEKYTEFQESLKKEIRKTFADNQTALYKKHQEYKAQATEILQMAKDQEIRLNTVFSDQALIQHMREVEAKVLKSSEDWRTRTQSAFDYETATTRKQLTDWSTQQKQELDAYMKQTLDTLHTDFTGGLDKLETMRLNTLELYAIQKQSIDTHVNQSLEKLRTDFTAGINKLEATHTNVEAMRSTLQSQIDEALTRERYQEFQEGIKQQISTWFQQRQTSIETLKTQLTEQTTSSIQALENQVTLWREMLSEERLRTFIDTIDKKLKIQQDNWTARRTQEFQQRYDAFTAKLQEYKTNVEDITKAYKSAEANLATTYGKTETRFQQALADWLNQKNAALETTTNKFIASIQTAELAWKTKEAGLDTQLEQWKKQTTATLQKGVDALKMEVQSTKDGFKTTVTDLTNQTQQQIQDSIQQSEKQRLTMYKETDAKLRALLQDWFSKKSKELDTVVEKSAEDIRGFQESLSQQQTVWIQQKERDYTAALSQAFTKLQLAASTATAEEKARISAHLTQVEERLLAGQDDIRNGLRRQLSGLESSFTSTQQSVDTLKAQSTSLFNDLATVQTVLTTLESEVRSSKQRDKLLDQLQQSLSKQRTELLQQLNSKFESYQQQATLLSEENAALEAIKKQVKQLEEFIKQSQQSLVTKVESQTETLSQRIERLGADTKSFDSTVKGIYKRIEDLQTSSTTQQSRIQDLTDKPHTKTVDRAIEQATLFFTRSKTELQTSLEKRITELSEVFNQVKIQTSEKTTEGLQSLLLKQKADVLQQMKTQFDTFQQQFESQLPSMTKMDAYHSTKLQLYESTFKKHSDGLQSTVDTLTKVLRGDVEAWLKASEQSKQTLFEHLRAEVQNHTTTWFTQRTNEFTGSLETYKAQIQALQKLIIANKDEWVSTKQKEFVVRLAEAVKQSQIAVQQASEKEHMMLLEKFQGLETVLKQKQESAEKLLQGSLEDRLKPIQVGLQLIQTTTEKTTSDIAVLFTITSELQSNATTTITERQVADAETLLATLTRLQAPETIPPVIPVITPAPIPPAPIVSRQPQLKQLQPQAQPQLQLKQPQPQPQPQAQAQAHAHALYAALTKCFYTAVFGLPGQQLDTLGHMKPPPGWDAICFTNQSTLKANGWRILQIPMEQATPILQAKYVKWNSHILLEEYDVAVWIDAHLAPNLSSTAFLQQWIPQAYTSKMSILHRKHDVRQCVWDECKAVVDAKRDTPEHVEALKRRLTAIQMPKQFGLFDTNMMIRFHKQKVCQIISEEVWKSLQVDTHRDQLVVTPVYYNKGFKAYATLPLQHAFDRSGIHVQNPAV